MITQLELTDQPVPQIGEHEIAWLMGELRGRRWMTAAEIMGGAATENEKRRIRSVAAAAGGQILSGPGTRGYILTQEATLEEIDHVVAVRRSQCQQMDVGTRAIIHFLHAHGLRTPSAADDHSPITIHQSRPNLAASVGVSGTKSASTPATDHSPITND